MSVNKICVGLLGVALWAVLPSSVWAQQTPLGGHKAPADTTSLPQSQVTTTGTLGSSPYSARVASDIPGSTASGQITPSSMAFTNTFEVWRLPDGERMGMLGSNLMMNVHPNYRLGIGSYGALTGHRGGFITLGFAGDVQQRLSENWLLHGGVFIGAGSGSGGMQLAGGGFMFRAAGGLTYQMGALGNVGVGVSWVSFPTGEIRSAQPYIMYEYPFYSALTKGWPEGSLGSKDGLIAPSKRQEFSIGWTGYKLPSSVKNSHGGHQNDTMQLLGVKWTSYFDSRWFMTIGAGGAFAGDSAGYMQILGGVGYRYPLTKSTGLKLYVEAGPAGGGAVATGGGLLFGGGVAVQQMITDRWAIELGIGGIKAISGDFKAMQVGVNLSYVFGTPKITQGDQPLMNLATYKASPVRVRAINQTYLKADDQWRTQKTGMSVNNMGAALDYFIHPNVYLTGQGLAAYSGDAGAYMTGLLGVGVQANLSTNWFVTAEALVGAAGGGTIATGNGSVWQFNAGVGYRITDNLSFILTGGRMEAPTGHFKSNVIGASLAYRFGVATK